MSEAIKMVRFQKRKHCSPCCFNSAPVFHLMPCAFGVNLADGDGVQDHLLPVCEDDACQRSTIYLSKSGSTEVLCVHREFTTFSTFSSLPFLPCLSCFFFFAVLSNLSPPAIFAVLHCPLLNTSMLKRLR